LPSTSVLHGSLAQRGRRLKLPAPWQALVDDERRERARRKLARAALACQESPTESARAAGLRHVSDEQPGIRRRRAGSGFRYLDPQGRTVRDAEVLARIRALAIPPAWAEVWICLDERGHLQAAGRDARGRKQYRYHPRWRQARDETKYHRMLAFAAALQPIRRRTRRDLACPGLPREKVLAAVVQLLEKTLIRVGNGEYVRQNGSFGLTTLHNRHVDVRGARLNFRFRGKSGREHDVGIEDPRLAAVVASCRDLPGQELFAYVDENGEVHHIGSADVNSYLREITGRDFTAKDFRTWAGTVLAARALQRFEPCSSAAAARRNIVAAIDAVARTLGNTKAVCRRSYVHPGLLEAYLDGTMAAILRNPSRRGRAAAGLRADEAAVVAILEDRLNREARAGARAQ
jgi:DNA topoisomerase-1